MPFQLDSTFAARGEQFRAEKNLTCYFPESAARDVRASPDPAAKHARLPSTFRRMPSPSICDLLRKRNAQHGDAIRRVQSNERSIRKNI
jgi:hypothetical protein